MTENGLSPRLSIVTLGVANVARARSFYEKLGWQPSSASQEQIVFFQLSGVVLALFNRDQLADDATVAPAGDENLFVLVPVPAEPGLGHGGIDGAGDPAVEAFVDRTIDRIAAWTGAGDLAERVVVRRTVGPGDFADDLRSWHGSALGPAHTLRQSAVLRAPNASRHVRGLLYAGGSTIPGIGVPMCLISAELVAKRVRGDRSASPLPERVRSRV